MSDIAPTNGSLGSLRDATLERVPDALYTAVVTGPAHDLEARIAGVMFLRAALIEGRTPSADGMQWPEPVHAHRLLAWLVNNELLSECRGSPERADVILNKVIDAANTSTLDTLLAMTSDRIFGLPNAIRVQSINTPEEAEIAAITDYLAHELLQPRYRKRMGGAYGEPIGDTEVVSAIRRYVAAVLPEWYRSVGMRSGTTALLEYLKSRDIGELYNFKVEHCVRGILEGAFAGRFAWQRAVIDGDAPLMGSSPSKPLP